MSRLTTNLTLIVIFFNFLTLNGQSKKELKEMFYEGEMFLLYEEYNEALPYFEQLSELTPDNSNYLYRLGICYLNLPGQKEKSLDYLQRAVQNINPKYRDGRFRESAAAYDAWYYLAKAYLVTNQIDKAIETYRYFLDGMDHRLYDSILVQKEIEACYNAKRFMSMPLYLKTINQGGVINDRFSEVNPVVSADEKTMVYTREAQLQDMIVFSEKINNAWTPGIVIMDQLLVDEGYTTSISPDGKELFLYRNDQYIGNIYSSRYIDGRWMPAKKLNDNINTRFWESHAAISGDGKKLYFTSNRPGGYGGLDIYVSKRDSTGDWGKAINLGPVINTPYNEETPFPDITNKVLFFSSRGHLTMGGHDILYSTMTDDTTWSVPVNMGYPVNSTDDDLFFHPVGEGYSAYVSRFDMQGYGLKDIQRVEVFSDNHPRKFIVRGMVTLKDLLEEFKDSVKVSAFRKENPDTLLIVYSDPATGEYEFEVPQGQYKIFYEADGSRNELTDLELKLTHPGDSIKLADRELSKSDYTAVLGMMSGDSLTTFEAGDSSTVSLKVEPNSMLTVKHFRGDSLLSTSRHMVNDSVFDYTLKPLAGDNTFTFELSDRFGNITSKKIDIRGKEVKKLTAQVQQEVSRDMAISMPDTVTTDIPDQKKTERSIKELDNKLAEISDASNNVKLREAIEETNSKNIQDAGEWLESLYSVAIGNGAEQDLLSRVIAAMSADINETPSDYLMRIADIADKNLAEVIRDIDTENLKLKRPEDIIEYLISNAKKYNYSRAEVFEAFAEMINTNRKSAEEIVEYIDHSEKKGRLWILWTLLGTGAFLFIILVSRKRKKDKEQ